MMRIIATQLAPTPEPDTYTLTYITLAGSDNTAQMNTLTGFRDSTDRDVLEKFIRALTDAKNVNLWKGSYMSSSSFTECFSANLNPDVHQFLSRTRQDAAWPEDLHFGREQALDFWEVTYYDRNSVAYTAFITLEG